MYSGYVLQICSRMGRPCSNSPSEATWIQTTRAAGSIVSPHPAEKILAPFDPKFGLPMPRGHQTNGPYVKQQTEIIKPHQQSTMLNVSFIGSLPKTYRKTPQNHSVRNPLSRPIGFIPEPSFAIHQIHPGLFSLAKIAYFDGTAKLPVVFHGVFNQLLSGPPRPPRSQRTPSQTAPRPSNPSRGDNSAPRGSRPGTCAA